MTSGELSQLIAALWSVGEQVCDSKDGNDVKGLRNVPHRNQLEKLAGGRSSSRDHCGNTMEMYFHFSSYDL